MKTLLNTVKRHYLSTKAKHAYCAAACAVLAAPLAHADIVTIHDNLTEPSSILIAIIGFLAAGVMLVFYNDEINSFTRCILYLQLSLTAIVLSYQLLALMGLINIGGLLF